MAPNGGHYRPNLSNNFNQFSQPHSSQVSHYQNQNANYHGHGFAGQPSFSTAHQNGPVNLFGGGPTNGGITNSFAGSTGLSGVGATGLASHEAQMRFAHGAALQQQQTQDTAAIVRATGMQTRIRDVWRGNLAQEMQMIRSLVDKYPYVSMDTEFPGVVARPMGNFPSKADYHYQCLRCNVDLLKLIQLGITLFSVEGDLPPAQTDNTLNRQTYSNNLIMCPCTWTFHFQFSLESDMYSEESVMMLKKAGVDFDKNAEMGIDPNEFGSLLTTSGLVLDDRISWLSFHSGYDFGYLVKIMNRIALPNDENDYLSIVRTWFPRIYDIKYLYRHAQRLAQRNQLSPPAAAVISALGSKSGLQDIADELGCIREGRPHTAGSDAWLTGLVFWQLRQKFFDNQIPEELVGMIWGLSGVGPPASAASQAAVLAGHQTPNTNGATLYHTGMTPSTNYKSDTPSTPQTAHTGLATTPGPHAAAHGSFPAAAMAGMAGGGTAYSGYQYGAR